MFKNIILILFIVFLGTTPLPSTHANSEAPLWQPVEASILSQTEKRFMQAALALAGHYDGLIDGAWGPRSDLSLAAFTKTTFNRETPVNADLGYIYTGFQDRIEREGLDIQYIEFLDMSMLLPLGKMKRDEMRFQFERWEHVSREFTVSLSQSSRSRMEFLHNATMIMDDAITPAYELRRKNRWVSSVRTRDQVIYLRSDRINGQWSNTYITSDYDTQGLLMLVSASLKIGNQPGIAPRAESVLAKYAAMLTDTE